jgi:hypothetical protein
MTSIVHGGAFNTTVLNPPNLNGFGAAANMVHGARSIATRAERKPAPQDRCVNDLRERRGKAGRYVAQANKTARIAWAILARGEVYVDTPWVESAIPFNPSATGLTAGIGCLRLGAVKQAAIRIGLPQGLTK